MMRCSLLYHWGTLQSAALLHLLPEHNYTEKDMAETCMQKELTQIKHLLSLHDRAVVEILHISKFVTSSVLVTNSQLSIGYISYNTICLTADSCKVALKQSENYMVWELHGKPVSDLKMAPVHLLVKSQKIMVA